MNMDLFDDVKRMDKRQFFYQVLSFGMIVSSALMIWKGLMVVTGSESPIVVVLSGSMEPAFHRGDLLFLTNYEQEDIRVGEIVVFKVKIFKSLFRVLILWVLSVNKIFIWHPVFDKKQVWEIP